MVKVKWVPKFTDPHPKEEQPNHILFMGPWGGYPNVKIKTDLFLNWVLALHTRDTLPT